MAESKARLPPRWLFRSFWNVHRRVVRRSGGRRGLWPPLEVLGRAAVGEERERLWQRWRELNKNLDSYATRRPGATAVVAPEPRAPAE